MFNRLGWGYFCTCLFFPRMRSVAGGLFPESDSSPAPFLPFPFSLYSPHLLHPVLNERREIPKSTKVIQDDFCWFLSLPEGHFVPVRNPPYSREVLMLFFNRAIRLLPSLPSLFWVRSAPLGLFRLLNPPPAVDFSFHLEFPQPMPIISSRLRPIRLHFPQLCSND